MKDRRTDPSDKEMASAMNALAFMLRVRGLPAMDRVVEICTNSGFPVSPQELAPQCNELSEVFGRFCTARGLTQPEKAAFVLASVYQALVMKIMTEGLEPDQIIDMALNGLPTVFRRKPSEKPN